MSEAIFRYLWFGFAVLLGWLLLCAVAQNWREPRVWALTSLCAAIALYYLLAFFEEFEFVKDFPRIHYFKWALPSWMAVGFAWFGSLYLEERPSWIRSLLKAGVAQASFFTVAIALRDSVVVICNFPPEFCGFGPLFPAYVLTYTIYASAGLAFLIRARARGLYLGHLDCLLGAAVASLVGQFLYVLAILHWKSTHEEILSLMAAGLLLCSFFKPNPIIPDSTYLKRSFIAELILLPYLGLAYRADKLLAAYQDDYSFPLVLFFAIVIALAVSPFWLGYLWPLRTPAHPNGESAESPEATTSPPPLDIRVMGTPEIRRNGALLSGKRWTPQVRRLFLHLLYHRERGASKEALIETLWPGEPPEKASARLHTVIHYLRKSLGEDGHQIVVFSEGRYLLKLPEGSKVDVDEFATLIRKAHSLLEKGAEDKAARILEKAVRLYRGPLLWGAEDAIPVEELHIERARVDEMYGWALHCLGNYYSARGDLAQSNYFWRKLLLLYPWDEEARRALSLNLRKMGQYEQSDLLLQHQGAEMPGV